MGGRPILLVAGAAAALGTLQTQPGSSARTPAEQRMAAIVQAWTKKLDAKNNASLARLYGLPAIVIQGPNGYRLKTYKEVALFFSLLPCSGKVVSITFKGDVATAVFRLSNRGTTKCDAPGGLAAARFEIVKGKIRVWEQVPVPAGASGNVA